MITLLLLGFALSLDSFRVSVGLGTLKLSRLRQLQIVTAFGVCDALAPLIGLLRPIDVQFNDGALYVLDFGSFEMIENGGVSAEPATGKIWRTGEIW